MFILKIYSFSGGLQKAGTSPMLEFPLGLFIVCIIAKLNLVFVNKIVLMLKQLFVLLYSEDCNQDKNWLLLCHSNIELRLRLRLRLRLTLS